MSDSQTEEEVEAEEKAVEIPTLDIKVSKVVDATYNLGNSKKIRVKSSGAGLRISYTRKTGTGYYQRSTTDGVTVPVTFLPHLQEILTKLAAEGE